LLTAAAELVLPAKLADLDPSVIPISFSSFLHEATVRPTRTSPQNYLSVLFSTEKVTRTTDRYEGIPAASYLRRGFDDNVEVVTGL
jgi:hypothetical protein